MIVLTHTTGVTTAVNPNHIVFVRPSADHTLVGLSTGGQMVVRQPFDEVVGAVAKHLQPA